MVGCVIERAQFFSIRQKNGCDAVHLVFLHGGHERHLLEGAANQSLLPALGSLFDAFNHAGNNLHLAGLHQSSVAERDETAEEGHVAGAAHDVLNSHATVTVNLPCANVRGLFVLAVVECAQLHDGAEQERGDDGNGTEEHHAIAAAQAGDGQDGEHGVEHNAEHSALLGEGKVLLVAVHHVEVDGCGDCHTDCCKDGSLRARHCVFENLELL